MYAMDASSLPVEPDFKRKPNFTDMEKLYLLQQYATHKVILSSKLCDGATTRQKQDTWHQIALGLNLQNPTVERTAKEVKKKWENLATLARKEIAEFRTGGGRSLLRPPSALTLQILELIDDISFNPPPGDGNMAIVKEEIWDEDSGSAEMSPSNVQNESTTTLPMTSMLSSNSQPSSSFTSTPTAAASMNGLTHYEPPSQIPIQTPLRPPFVANSYSLKRPRTPPEEVSNELTSLKKRKLHLEAEKLELENEKLRLELEILKIKLKSLKDTRRATNGVDEDELLS